MSNASTTLANIQTSRTLFELAIVVGAVGAVEHILLGLILYRLFSPVGKGAASLTLAFVIAPVPFLLAAMARQIDVLSLLDGALGLPVFRRRAAAGAGHAGARQLRQSVPDLDDLLGTVAHPVWVAGLPLRFHASGAGRPAYVRQRLLFAQLCRHRARLGLYEHALLPHRWCPRRHPQREH